MKTAKAAIFIVLLSLAACDQGPSDTDILAASVSLTSAQNAMTDGKPIDRAALEAMLGLQAALEKNGRALREQVSGKLKDPKSVIWGDIWTVDYVHYCGDFNAKNSLGAYTGSQTFISQDGVSVRISGDPLWQLEDLVKCSGGPRRIVLPADAS